MEEIWKNIVGYDNYKISNLGNIINIKKNKLLIYSNHNGYNRVGLCNKGKEYKFFIHRLIAQAFIPNPENKPQVNHKDGNKQNNCVDNLEWCTAKENTLHSFKVLGKKTLFQTLEGANKTALGKFGKDNPCSKKVNQYDKQGNFIKTWDSMSDIQRKLSIDIPNISTVCKLKRKTAGGYKWQYA